MPGRDFTGTFLIKLHEFPKFGVISGIAKGWRRCRGCKIAIKKGQKMVKVHKFGECPSFFHPNCAIKVADLLELAAESATLIKHSNKCKGIFRLIAELPGDLEKRIPRRKIYACTECTYERVVYKEIPSGRKKEEGNERKEGKVG